VNLDGWTVEEMAVESSAALVVIWPAIVTRSFDFSTYSWKNTPFKDAQEKAKEKQDELRDWMDAARQYEQAKGAKNSRAVRDQKLAALAKCLDGRMPVVIQADAKRDIEAVVGFAEEYGLNLILSGGRDAWKVKETLAEKDIPVILGRTYNTPREQDDPYDRPYATPGMLREAGIRIAFSSGAGVRWGSGGAHSSRTTPYEAGMAAAFGLSEDEAMKALTLWPAEMLGVDDRLGSLEPGKIANVIVTDGSPLAMSSNVQHLIIAGQEVPTDNLHRSLYEKYRARPLPKPDAALEASR
jgi:imidazolonepropionase-like amidohydrolase